MHTDEPPKISILGDRLWPLALYQTVGDGTNRYVALTEIKQSCLLVYCTFIYLQIDILIAINFISLHKFDLLMAMQG